MSDFAAPNLLVGILRTSQFPPQNGPPLRQGKMLSQIMSSRPLSRNEIMISDMLDSHELRQALEPGPLATWVTSMMLCNEEEADAQQLARHLPVNHILSP